MTILCGKCGQQMLVDDEIVEGQHVKCPFCGEKTEYQKPSRIAVPFNREYRSSPQSKKTSVNMSEPEQSKTSSKPTLTVIRPDKPSKAVVTVSSQPKPPKASVRRARSKEHPIYYSLAILVAGVCVAGIFALNHHQRQQEREFAAEERRKEFERREAEEKRRTQREAEERDRAAKRQAAEEATRKEKEEAARVQREKIAAEKATKLEASRLCENRKAVVQQAFGVKYDYWRNCPKEDRPGSVTERREYVCLLPRGDATVDCLLIVATPNDGLDIKTYEEDGTQNPMTEADFQSMLKMRSPYLILSNGKGWICGVDKEPNGCAVVDDLSCINPSEMELGALYGFLKSGHADLSGLTYNVYFVAKNGGREFIRSVKFGETVSAGDVKPIIREDLQEKADSKKQKGNASARAKFKRTVVFGAVPNIKRQIAGPIIIPYSMPAYEGYGVDYQAGYWNRNGFKQTYSRKSTNSAGTREQEYLNLRAVAEKEDREESEWKNRQFAMRMKEAHFEIPESAVEKILFSGRFVYSSVAVR